MAQLLVSRKMLAWRGVAGRDGGWKGAHNFLSLRWDKLGRMSGCRLGGL